jgi:hypothetical protein
MAALDSDTYEIVSVAAVVENSASSQSYLFIINQAANIPDVIQHESLLHTDQARYHNVIIDNLSKFFHDSIGNQGKQSVEVDGFEIPLLHDGSKCFLKIRKPTNIDWEQLPILKLTSPISWKEDQYHARRMKQRKHLSAIKLQEWSKRLGHLNLDITKRTLDAPTQMISTA